MAATPLAGAAVVVRAQWAALGGGGARAALGGDGARAVLGSDGA